MDLVDLAGPASRQASRPPGNRPAIPRRATRLPRGQADLGVPAATRRPVVNLPATRRRVNLLAIHLRVGREDLQDPGAIHLREVLVAIRPPAVPVAIRRPEVLVAIRLPAAPEDPEDPEDRRLRGAMSHRATIPRLPTAPRRAQVASSTLARRSPMAGASSPRTPDRC